MKKNILFLFLLFPLWVVSSCSNGEESVSGEPQPMRFSFYMKDGDKVTPLSRAAAADLEATGISLYCSYHQSPFTPTGGDYPKIYWNTSVDANGNVKDGIPRYWMMSSQAYYTFWAHSENPTPKSYPSVPAGYAKWGVTGGLGGGANHHDAIYSFLQLNDPRQQIDFLVADRVKDQQAVYIAPVVGLYFSHFLSRVKLRFYNSHGTQLNNCVAKITYGSGDKKLYSGFDANLGSGHINLGDVSKQVTHSGTYPIHDATFTMPATTISPDDAYMAGDVILVPQIVKDGFITVELTYTSEGKTESETAEVEIPAPDRITSMAGHSQGATGTFLQRGNAYTYNINVIVETTSLKIGNVVLSSWEGQNSTVVDWTDY